MGAEATWLRRNAGGDLLIALHVQPGAKKTEIAGVHGDALKVRLAAPPVEGRANEALIAFLAQKLDVARRDVELVSGASSRRKVVRVSGAPEGIEARLLADSQP